MRDDEPEANEGEHLRTFNDDFLAFKNPGLRRADLCSILLHSPWG